MESMEQRSKWLMLLRSRKFWGSVVGLVSVLVVTFFGAQELPVEALVDAIVLIVSVFVASTALEDGLSRR
jgi:4-hydroxybenzoate polyprenyltransferase